MSSYRLPCLAVAVCAFLLPALAHAQAAAIVDENSATAATTTVDGASGIVPVQKGFNLSLNTTSQHDSSNGWSSLLTPSAAYRFNKNFSADASIPLYDYIVVEVSSTTTRKVTTTGYATKHFVAGDTVLNGHAQFSPSLFDYELTGTVGFQTGNTTYGLGAGQVTYQFNNTFQQSYGIFTPTIGIGIGDSSSLSQTRVRKAYTSVGTEGVFQAGTSVDLPYDLNFSASAYENLPIAAQTLYSTTGRGKKKVTTATGKSVAEDNGFETSLDIPLTTHVTLSGFYNRSLRSRIDTVGFSFLFLLKAHPKDSVH